MSVVAVLTAAGSGSRLGRALPKALVPLFGEPLVVHAARRLAAARAPGDQVRSLLDAIVVTAPADLVDAFAAALTAVADEPGLPRIEVVPGGATRQASVAAALTHLPDDDDAVVLVHDAARPLTPPALVEDVAAAVEAGHDAVVPGLPVVDTVKRVETADATGARVTATVDRTLLRAVQTPQGFRLALLRRAHAEAAAHAHDEAVAASDDAGLVERLGCAVWVVPGDERAGKITTARDLRVAELLGEDA